MATGLKYVGVDKVKKTGQMVRVVSTSLISSVVTTLKPLEAVRARESRPKREREA